MNYTLEAPFGNPHGKLSKKNCQIIWAQNNGTGTRFTQVRIPRNSQEPTAAQIAVIAKFKQASTQTNSIMQDIDRLKPYRQAWVAKIKSGNTRYKTLRGYIFAEVYKNL